MAPLAVDTTLEKPLPSNLDAERSVLGAILLDNNALNAAIENLRPEDFFLDQHRRVFTQMVALGETQQRLDCLSAWRETSFFSEREQAALAWAESLTLIAETHAPDDDYQAATKHFSDKELVDLTMVIVNMNAWNRIAIGFHKPVPVRAS